MPATNPMQPFVKKERTIRFKENAIVNYLLECGRIGKKVDLNDLACLPFSQDDRCQFAQLIGYSLHGYHELSYVSDTHAKEATKAAQKEFPQARGCRDSGCPIHVGVENEE